MLSWTLLAVSSKESYSIILASASLIELKLSVMHTRKFFILTVTVVFDAPYPHIFSFVTRRTLSKWPTLPQDRHTTFFAGHGLPFFVWTDLPHLKQMSVLLKKLVCGVSFFFLVICKAYWSDYFSRLAFKFLHRSLGNFDTVSDANGLFQRGVF